jgi:hypothetical protein
VSRVGERPSLESVLDGFAVEREHDAPTLERYLELYPEYAGDLVDLSRELSREACDDTSPLSDTDQALINAAWARYAAPQHAATADPFAALTVNDLRAVAQRLDVPRQVVTALRERRISLVSIPRQLLGRLAEAVNCSVTQLELFWGGPQLATLRTYKADGKPNVGEQVTLEQVLIDAGVPAEQRARLLAKAD